MIGTQRVSVSNRASKFEFELHRNITIVRGNSGTGKTTLYNMIADYTRLGKSSGVSVSCPKNCVALVDSDWKNQLKSVSDSIVFIDEGERAVSSQEFADAIKKTDNYYVIFNREGLHELPYSVEEIYEIHSSGKYHKFVKVYKADNKHVYYSGKKPSSKEFNLLLTEDSKSGYRFFKHFCEEHGITCQSAQSKSKVYKWLLEHKDENVFVVADGAAFGSDIDRVMKLGKVKKGHVLICLPESFEWMILKSGVIHTGSDETIVKMLNNPGEHIDSRKYFSWENFFYDYLKEITKDTPFRYDKRSLNKLYLTETNVNKIISEII